MTRVLLLAGTAEALALSHRLDGMPGVDLVTSLAGATRQPADYAGKVRTGGFGGAEGLASYLADQRIGLLIDATHPFATTIGRNAAEAAERAGVPRLRLLRPPWPEEPGWLHAPDLEGALGLLPRGAHALATTGAMRTGALASRPDCRITLRAIEEPGPLPDHVEVLLARPPFSEADERALMERLGVTHLVTRNAGGGNRGRLDAARSLGIPVVMIDRPPSLPGPMVATVDDAVAWVRGKVAS